ncbi:MAG: hypothetical protein ACE14M_02620 [Terriglobales bacterium]
MDRLIGIKLLAASFFFVAAGLVVFSMYWVFVAQPLRSVGSLVLIMLVPVVLAFAIGTIGIGIVEQRNTARWTAFATLVLLAMFALVCAFYDAAMQREAWLLIDLVLFALFASPAVYLLLPRVRATFTLLLQQRRLVRH